MKSLTSHNTREVRLALAFRAACAVCILTAGFLGHHPVAGAQSVDNAVSPVVPSDAAELSSSYLKRDWAHTEIGLRIVLPPADVASFRAQGNQPLQMASSEGLFAGLR